MKIIIKNIHEEFSMHLPLLPLLCGWWFLAVPVAVAVAVAVAAAALAVLLFVWFW